MRKSIVGLTAVALFALSTPAMAQDEDTSGITITGGGAVVSDYRFRGISQSNEDFAIQGSFTVTHESGLYVGVWGSSISFAQGAEIDAIGGFAHEIVPGLTGDVGFTYYLYPNKIHGQTDGEAGLSANEIIEPYVALSGTVGPVWAKLGFAYAPKQSAYFDGEKNNANTYLWGDAALSVPNTPVKITGHVGWTSNHYNRTFLNTGIDDGEGGFILTDSKANYLDFGLGASATYKALTFGVNFVSTDVSKRYAFREGAGADSTVVFSIGAAF